MTPTLRTCMAALLVGACAAVSRAPAPSDWLPGRWRGPDSDTFVFGAGGEALWIFALPAGPDTFRIRYDVAPGEEEPTRLDLSGFDRGFLAGRTLFCIAEPEGADAFRMDCEPGPAGAGDATRPDAFAAQTKRYRRVP